MRKGFTLVEMLVAVVLLTLLIGVALFAFRLQIITISKVKKSSIDLVIKYENIHASLESMRYYVVDTYDILDRPMKKLHYFFQGDSKSMLYISENPILSEEIAVSKLLCKDKKLLYYEEPLYQYIDYLKPKIPEGNKPLTLFSNLKICKFSYVTVHGNKVDLLKDTIPRKVFVSLETNKKDISVIARIFNDLNNSKAKIQDAIYSK